MSERQGVEACQNCGTDISGVQEFFEADYCGSCLGKAWLNAAQEAGQS